ncbi:hypothetical protein ACTI_04720 [Actinoplanes sp. OR16]|nr:hypothetical protein ACTI_04720 [Actinoplanes sp. OR16]
MLDLDAETLPSQIEPDEVGDRPLVLDDEDQTLARRIHGVHHAAGSPGDVFEEGKGSRERSHGTHRLSGKRSPSRAIKTSGPLCEPGEASHTGGCLAPLLPLTDQ